MKIHSFRENSPEWLGLALERFEHQFQYPLGSDETFRISHGREYMPFFAAMGTATLLVAEQAGAVMGTLVRVERWIEVHGREVLRQPVHYLADVKISAEARGGHALAALMLEAKRQIELTGSRSCYGVVMSGTACLPSDYTGRVGIPSFEKIADIMILRMTPGKPSQTDSTAPIAPIAPIASTASTATDAGPDCVIMGRRRELRSQMNPIPLAGGAWLEDTRRGKRLWTSNGAELMSAHLSSFRFDLATDGVRIIQSALERAQSLGFPAVFTAVPASRYPALRAALTTVSVQEAPAAIYGHSMNAHWDWWVDTAEI
jgi:hypothetical protein